MTVTNAVQVGIDYVSVHVFDNFVAIHLGFFGIYGLLAIVRSTLVQFSESLFFLKVPFINILIKLPYSLAKLFHHFAMPSSWCLVSFAHSAGFHFLYGGDPPGLLSDPFHMIGFSVGFHIVRMFVRKS